MQIQRAVAPVLLAGVLSASAAPAFAQSSPSSPSAMAPAHVQTVKQGSELVKVTNCKPSLNVMQSGGFAGYSPAYWGGYRGYWGWPDVYGASFYQPPVTTANPQLGIDYVNISHHTMHEIQFGLIANGILRAEVRDVGTFSPGAEIKHSFGISANVFPIQTGLPQCVPLHIQFADGTKWRNPHLPPKNQKIYLHP
jgi:hypothetical protein